MVFGDLNNSAGNINSGKVKTFLLNIENLNKLKNIDFGTSQIITCGLHEKDTVIFSSIDADESSVMLELQRDIINIKDESMESFEKKITLECGIESEETADILLALAVMMYCGRIK
jgi:superfamily I DNA and/or RNA helicase